MFRNVEKNREILDTFEKNSFLDATITRNIGLEQALVTVKTFMGAQ